MFDLQLLAYQIGSHTGYDFMCGHELSGRTYPKSASPTHIIRCHTIRTWRRRSLN